MILCLLVILFAKENFVHLVYKNNFKLDGQHAHEHTQVHTHTYYFNGFKKNIFIFICSIIVINKNIKYGCNCLAERKTFHMTW